MPEDFPTFSVDSDWKKQAQEEKRRLAEEAESQKAALASGASAARSPATAEVPETPGSAGARSPASRRGRTPRDGLPDASFITLVQTLASQVLAYLGGVALASGEAMVDLDTAKHQIDLMAVLEVKSKGNLTTEEQAALDVALYETRMRYVSVASRYIL